jgi:hypothetical protein
MCKTRSGDGLGGGAPAVGRCRRHRICAGWGGGVRARAAAGSPRNQSLLARLPPGFLSPGPCAVPLRPRWPHSLPLGSHASLVAKAGWDTAPVLGFGGWGRVVAFTDGRRRRRCRRNRRLRSGQPGFPGRGDGSTNAKTRSAPAPGFGRSASAARGCGAAGAHQRGGRGGRGACGGMAGRAGTQRHGAWARLDSDGAVGAGAGDRNDAEGGHAGRCVAERSEPSVDLAQGCRGRPVRNSKPCVAPCCETLAGVGSAERGADLRQLFRRKLR